MITTDDFPEIFNAMAATAHATSVRNGFKHDNIGLMIALIHSELSEALEALRHEDSENFAEELADVVIRVMDLSASQNINLGGEIEKKMKYNESRPHKHGKKF